MGITVSLLTQDNSLREFSGPNALISAKVCEGHKCTMGVYLPKSNAPLTTKTTPLEHINRPFNLSVFMTGMTPYLLHRLINVHWRTQVFNNPTPHVEERVRLNVWLLSTQPEFTQDQLSRTSQSMEKTQCIIQQPLEFTRGARKAPMESVIIRKKAMPVEKALCFSVRSLNHFFSLLSTSCHDGGSRNAGLSTDVCTQL